MAYCISGQKDIEGRLLFLILRKYLPDNYSVFHQPNITGYQPNFLLIGPHLGCIVLEIEHLTSLTHSLRSDQTTTRFHLIPSLLRARNFANQITQILQQPAIPFGYGIVLPQLYKQDLLQKGLYLHHSPLILTRDDIDPYQHHLTEQKLISRLTKLIIQPAPFSDAEMNTILERLSQYLLPSKKTPLSNR